MLIGVTGLYCAGKNYIASLLEKKGFSVLDVDLLGHEAIENKKDEIFARFGEGIKNPLLNENKVNRRLLGEKVFGREKEMAALEEIIHPEVNRMTEQWIVAQNGKNCAINAALLHRSSVFRRLDCVVLVCAPWFIRLMRAKRRDKLPWAAIIRRFSSQKQFFAQYLAGNADIYKVENPCVFRKPELQIDEILKALQGGFC
jgi:dephospho-CoA kinase